MLDRRYRLTSSAGFAAATRRGRRAGSRTVVLHLGTADTDRHRPTPAEPRVGFVVSKAVGNAVARNRVKRRLRSLLQERLSSLPGGSVLVVRALPAAAGASYASLGRDVDTGLRRLGTGFHEPPGAGPEKAPAAGPDPDPRRGDR